MHANRLDALRAWTPAPKQAGGKAESNTFEASLQRAAAAPPTAPTAHAQALDLLAAQQASNMQYLALQHALSNPKTSVISNVLKVRHEAAKNAIGNIR